ncbi:MAG TPA: carboxypeptidase-like regulatory domain-containing protein [Nitrospiraceae bacterium]|nr:carboxypeptidase-like regulatory domain-containing protein [Nitrospiraceae bacterium]
MGLCLVNHFDGPGGCSHLEAGDVVPELARRRIVQVVCFLLAIVGWKMMAIMPLAQAEHEVDHRFIVEGYVCGGDGRSIANQEVMVKDTRIPLGKTTYTDSDGFYSVTLHLHNDNQGDPILVAAGDREQRLTAKFDAKDMKAERKMTVNFGSGCEGAHSGPGKWVYYSVGLGLAGVAVFAGARMIRKQRRPVKRGKSQRK